MAIKHNTIKEAVEPIRQHAMDAAEKWAREQVTKAKQELIAADWDLEKAAPYPRSSGISRADFSFASRRYYFFRSITTSHQSTRSMHEPNFCDINHKGVGKFVKEARDGAAAKYEAFVAKLEKKVGSHSSAQLFGNHVWGWSFLRVETPTGVQVWKTRQITNVSCLGTYFPQWPSRQIKEPSAAELEAAQ